MKAFDYKLGEKNIHAFGKVVEEIKTNNVVVGYVIQTPKKKTIVRTTDIVKVADSHYDLIMGGEKNCQNLR